MNNNDDDDDVFQKNDFKMSNFLISYPIFIIFDQSVKFLLFLLK